MRTLLKILLTLLVAAGLLLAGLWPRYDYGPPVQPSFSAERFAGNPVVTADLHPALSAARSEGGYVNIAGPSVIRVPTWVERPLGRYYLYFAHHKGDHIRLAYADSPLGPWTLHEPGALSLPDSGFPVAKKELGPNSSLQDLWKTFSVSVARDYLLMSYRSTVTDQRTREQRGIDMAANSAVHIASPDIYIDEENQRFVMYFHGMGRSGYQHSGMASSADGLKYKAIEGRIFSTYLRTFQYAGQHYLMGMPGVLYRSGTPDGGFNPRDQILFDHNMRHSAVWVQGKTLHVIWSRVGDAPERLLYSTVDLSPADWNDWVASEGVELMRPAAPWEGSELPVLSSMRGEMDGASNELRDPFVFVDADGRHYLYYVGSGEQAIGVARLIPP